MIKTLVSIGLAGCLAVPAGWVWAAGSTQVIGEYTINLAADYNGDGKVTLEEHQAWARSIFEQMDLDGNGYITTTEMAVFRFKQLESVHAKTNADASLEENPPMINLTKFSAELDTDGDGKVSLAEHLASETKTFRGLANSAGVITAKEVLDKDKSIKADIEQKLRLLREQKNASNQQPVNFDFQK